MKNVPSEVDEYLKNCIKEHKSYWCDVPNQVKTDILMDVKRILEEHDNERATTVNFKWLLTRWSALRTNRRANSAKYLKGYKDRMSVDQKKSRLKVIAIT